MALRFTRFTTSAITAIAFLSLPGFSYATDLVFGQVASQTNPASIANAKGMAIGIQAYFDKVRQHPAGPQAQAGHT
jgi:branched-chain amino acid transport system substrate-binding protein